MQITHIKLGKPFNRSILSLIHDAMYVFIFPDEITHIIYFGSGFLEKQFVHILKKQLETINTYLSEMN